MHKIYPIALTVALFAAIPAKAETLQYIPYAGIDYGYVHATARNMNPNYHAFGINLGTKYNDYFGTELFLSQTGSEAKKYDGGKYKTSYRAYGLDIAAYLPLGCYHTFDLIGTAGIGEYIFNEKLSGSKHHNNSAWGYRIGAGMMYNLSENISLRALVRYVGLDGISRLDHLTEYTAGLRYHFL